MLRASSARTSNTRARLSKIGNFRVKVSTPILARLATTGVYAGSGDIPDRGGLLNASATITYANRGQSTLWTINSIVIAKRLRMKPSTRDRAGRSAPQLTFGMCIISKLSDACFVEPITNLTIRVGGASGAIDRVTGCSPRWYPCLLAENRSCELVHLF